MTTTEAIYGYDCPCRLPKFTGKPRDYESGLGLDYFDARYMSSAQGRFTSPDPVFFQAEMLADPQRFNLYAYGRNNPLRFVDPTVSELNCRTMMTIVVAVAPTIAASSN